MLFAPELHDSRNFCSSSSGISRSIIFRMIMILVYALLGMMLCSRASSADFDKCEVPMLEASLSFTLKYYKISNSNYRIDYEQQQRALLSGYGDWQFAIIQNHDFNRKKAIRVIINCVKDCPEEPVTVPSRIGLTVRDEKELIFEYSYENLREKEWDEWLNDPWAGFLFYYSNLSKRRYGQRVTVSFTMFVPKTDGRCRKVDTDEVRQRVANQCFESFRSNDPLVTLQFRDKNLKIYPSILESHSTFLKELLDIQRANKQALVIDFSDFSSNVGEMILEILCSGTIHETALEDRAKHISALMKVYELGHKYQMDNVMQAAVTAFEGINPRPNGPETFDFMILLSTKKSDIGDEYLNSALQVEFNSDTVQKNQDEPQSKLRQLFNKMRL